MAAAANTLCTAIPRHRNALCIFENSAYIASRVSAGPSAKTSAADRWGSLKQDCRRRRPFCWCSRCGSRTPRYRSWVGEETRPEASKPTLLRSPTGLTWPAQSGWKRALV